MPSSFNRGSIRRHYSSEAQSRIAEDFRELAGRGRRFVMKQAFYQMEEIKTGLNNQYLARLSLGKLTDTLAISAFVHWVDIQRPGYRDRIDREFSTLPEKFSESAHHSSEFSSFDSVFSAQNCEYLDRLKLIRRRADKDLVQIPISDYAHASLDHAIKTTEFIDLLFHQKIAHELEVEEKFILGVFAYIHDIGMKPMSDEATPKHMYAIHARQSQLFVQRLNDEGLLNSKESDEIGVLCKYHNRPIEEAMKSFEVAPEGSRLHLIFSMFRIADMLDVELQPGEMLRIHPDIIRQTIAEVIPMPDENKVVIIKAPDTPSGRFDIWKRYFSNRLDGFNAQLSEISAEYTVEYQEFDCD
ncbi:HD domain-containing protein [Ponticaulis koreensis]|uniref:HD domain-containing protein n=1 Tax=Ponticaulis koreensis TaxID=1123045 RepID=UPI00040412A3|nr:hypothetical protein [Ponticaulis koreensis]